MNRMGIMIVPLSGSVEGKPIKITATKKPGIIIHIKKPKSKRWQEIWAWAINKSRTKVILNVELCNAYGTVAEHKFEIPINSIPTNIAAGILYTEPFIMRAVVSKPGVVSITGYVNQFKGEK